MTDTQREHIHRELAHGKRHGLLDALGRRCPSDLASRLNALAEGAALSDGDVKVLWRVLDDLTIYSELGEQWWGGCLDCEGHILDASHRNGVCAGATA